MTDLNCTTEKTCPDCGESYANAAENFYSRYLRGKLCFSKLCKTCTCLRAKEKRAREPELTKLARKRNYASNPEPRKAAARRYRADNLERSRQRTREYHRKNYDTLYAKATVRRRSDLKKRSRQQADYIARRRQEDPLFAITFRTRNLIKESLRGKGVRKNTKTERILGCTFEQFKQHLESQFVDGMNWENRGLWHIDHFIPMASAKTEDEVIKLNHYSNLRPLWAIDNLKKADKVPNGALK